MYVYILYYQCICCVCVCVCLGKRDNVCQILRCSTEQTGHCTGTDSELNDRPLSDQEVPSPLKLQWYKYLSITLFYSYLIKLKY